MQQLCVVIACATGAILAWGIATPQAAGSDLQGVVRASGRAARDVVIWLEAPDGPPPASHATARLDQRNMQFVPRVLAVRVGTSVEMPNSDRLLHNVFSFHYGKAFDLGLYPVGASKIVKFERPGLSRIFCNIHPNMAAYVLAVDSAYFAVSDGQGRFTIAAVPDGTYTYHAWRAGDERTTGTLGAVPGRPVEVALP